MLINKYKFLTNLQKDKVRSLNTLLQKRPRGLKSLFQKTGSTRHSSWLLLVFGDEDILLLQTEILLDAERQSSINFCNVGIVVIAWYRKAGKRNKSTSLGAVSCLEDDIKSQSLFNIDMLLHWPEIILVSKDSSETSLRLFIFKTFITWHYSICLIVILIYRIFTWREPNIDWNILSVQKTPLSQNERWIVGRWLDNDFPSCF